MPELPEVETIKNKLSKNIIGKNISNIQILSEKNFIGDSEKVINKKILDISRIGKYLAIELSDKYFLNIHLKMTGQIFIFNKNKKPDKNTRIVIYFSDNSVLFFNDLRKFGYIKLDKEKEKQYFIDILSSKFTFEYFKEKSKKTKKPIKAFLLDQEIMAGLGNIYANDALFLSEILPMRKTNGLTDDEIVKLFKSIIFVINEGVKYGGATAKDKGYVQPDGEHGQYQNYFKVYSREGKKCLKCGTLIKRIKQNGRSSFFCSHCQK